MTISKNVNKIEQDFTPFRIKYAEKKPLFFTQKRAQNWRFNPFTPEDCFRDIYIPNNCYYYS
jgi:hypothetical protein